MMVMQETFNEIQGLITRIEALQIKGDINSEFSHFLTTIGNVMQSYTSRGIAVFTRDAFAENMIDKAKQMTEHPLPNRFQYIRDIKTSYGSISSVNRLYYRADFLEIKQLLKDAKKTMEHIDDDHASIQEAVAKEIKAQTILMPEKAIGMVSNAGLTLFSLNKSNYNAALETVKASFGRDLGIMVFEKNAEVAAMNIGTIDKLISHFESTGSDAVFVNQLIKSKKSLLERHPSLNNLEGEQPSPVL